VLQKVAVATVIVSQIVSQNFLTFLSVFVTGSPG
jgi:hypothetical protein